ncbi:type II toxin-antitoxin system HipA family toxin [Vibrio sp. SCSIO 43137]|uniref:type II toxin-antitoxin system HipA family toxin n=1 Tax=Vibrio sp. SCSIO 43137 TaxID=3021011 RepID=UPI002307BBE9|nr:type II toxin-antitoxin system HipA family toxin [Vibrio sp. SCSIO 43137]WCE32187.1 type II toxin-antitoxin system HipA family toxin [Vibrio sp. SCSIO 43137]
MLNSKLYVYRTLTNAEKVLVGTLAENRDGCYFQYDDGYLATHSTSLSPFKIKSDTSIQKAPRTPHYGIHGVFADSLPDGWGLYLMDRLFRANGYNPRNISALERLAFVGNNCLGSLSYEPEITFGRTSESDIDLITLGKEAISEFEGTESHLIEYLCNTSGSGGARPKMNVTKLADGSYSTDQRAVGEKLIVKLTSDKFDLKHYESLVEYLYMGIAKNLGFEVADFNLLDAGSGHYWLQQSRFDCTEQGGRKHMLSACGLLDAPFREPSLDYVDLIKATRILCGDLASKEMVRRALFNYITVNQDDHSKNFSFIANDDDSWSLSPVYDIVYSPSPYAEHATSFNGDGRSPLKALTIMARQAGYANEKSLLSMAEEIYQGTRSFVQDAKELGVPPGVAGAIDSDITTKWLSLKS